MEDMIFLYLSDTHHIFCFLDDVKFTGHTLKTKYFFSVVDAGTDDDCACVDAGTDDDCAGVDAGADNARIGTGAGADDDRRPVDIEKETDSMLIDLIQLNL
jgi:hypothetical protein